MTRLAALVVLLAANATAEAQSQRENPQRPTASSNQPSASDPRGTSQAPLVIEVKPTPKTDEESAEHQQEIERDETTAYWNKWSARAAIGFGILQVGLIGFQAFIALRQNKIIDAQRELMKNEIAIATKAADAAKASADAATQSAIAAQHAVESNRPFLELVNPRIDVLRHDANGFSSRVGSFQFIFDVHNYGVTAARLDKIKREIAIFGEKDRFIETTATPRTMVPPGAHHNLRIYVGELTASEDDILRTKGMLLIQITGRLVYVDQFGYARIKRFGWLCQFTGGDHPVIHPIDLPGYNEEEGWGERPKPASQPQD